MNTILIASDHAGVDLKAKLVDHLYNNKGIVSIDLGPHITKSVDYPDYANELCSMIDEHEGRGILICGTGIGMSIAANRWKGIRCALVLNPAMALLARQHNNANVIAIGSRIVTDRIAVDIVNTFIGTPYDGGRHDDRLAKLLDGCVKAAD